ncbi:uracil-DNA glycosylase [Rubrivirga marina]|uniref:Type-4 uracil-DNA glycosylase n=1 Tax=Rubrivirga marina TaxID=1196024 RepID=A0A271IX71_9BACT|nr:uracil-DNA glycosylase [Rubrivirga marina]PAP75851.1 uracil-DNA glycosylase [Rubrivirga marina]
MADAAPALADVLREARALLALQRRLAGPVRYLGGADAKTAIEAGRIAEPEAAPPALAGRPTEPLAEPAPAAPADSPERRAEAEPPAPAAVDAEDLPDDDVPDLFGDLPDPSLDETLSPYERIEALIPEGHPLHGMDSLGDVRAWLAANELVPIDRDRINPVLGTGDPDADLMIVGEAPGADEDRTGEPFVGRAGQLLNKILEAVHFQREEVYITNILKSRPPNNRDPLPEEVEAHIPVLYKQIALVRPKVILAVGKSAGNGLLGKKSSLASLRGKFNDFYGLPLMVTYHPAALLRNPQWKRPTWEDVKLLRTRYDQITSGA